MRNIFDQYSQSENRVTHALMTALNEDRKLLAFFLRELVKVNAPTDPSKLLVLEQKYPDKDEEPSEDDLERRGIPDGWIFDNDGWCVFIESKVIAKLEADQINRHRSTAEHLGFQSVTAVAIAPVPVLSTFFPEGTVLLEWRKVYAWLCKHGVTSKWARAAADYLEIVEAKLIDTEQFVEGSLTMFSGFPFGRDHRFTYLEGKRVLKLAIGELRGREELKQLGVTTAPGRAITDDGDYVWDILWLVTASEQDKFTRYPHLTLGIGSDAMVTVPNAVKGVTRPNLVKLGEQHFQALAGEIVNNMKPLLREKDGPTPCFRGVQRRWPSRKAALFVDAEIMFDLRTAIPESGPPKMQQRRWLSAAYDSFVNREKSNYEIQMGALFSYQRCPELRQADAIDWLVRAWCACKPLVDLTGQVA